MAAEIRLKPITAASFTITLASLASGSARQATVLSNSSNYPRALVYIRIKSNTAPTAGGSYDIYLGRSDGTVRTDGAGASDAAITVLNARLLGSIVVTASATTNFFGIFDTGGLGALGTEWFIIVKNNTSQAISATESDHYYKYAYLVPEVQ